MKNFEPGPYVLHEHKQRFEIHPLQDEHGEKTLADVYFIENGGKDKARAQAMLFAAAPDMLAALEAMEGYLASHAEKGDKAAIGLHNMARAAIAKAKGESI